jgi:hypothetical protein
MMPNRATDCGTGHPMMSCYVTDHAPDDGAFNTAMGVGNDRQRRRINR